ncbi:uncharacterized protein CDAR_221221 [Caerostris darwini]|uniref:GATA zinc finger domain-containing protein 14-like n=1 Tax=Caerostris darwini TaxID=1538125 RepID=A0AAV4WME3_9ARAC|nr:uncharacterized protein CDAR_221221 [Caerostris darwini]
MTFRSSSTVLLAFCLVLKSLLCFAVFPQSSSKNGFNSFDLNNLLDPPSKLSFKHKDILDYMDREIDKLSQKAAFISDYEGIGYKEYTDTLLTPEKVKNKTEVPDTSTKSESKTNVDLKNFINKSIFNRSEAESNNHVSHVDPTDGYNLQSPEVIVKELGNRAPNSAGYQDKVVYIPVYDSSNSQSGKNEYQKYSQNGLNNGPNKKAIGFIGVVFVHKMQPGDAILNHGENNFPQQPNGISHNVQRAQSVYNNVPVEPHQKLPSNSISVEDAFQQQVNINGFNDETYKLQMQQKKANLPFQAPPPPPPQFNPNNIQWQGQNPSENSNVWRTNSGYKNIPGTVQILPQAFPKQSVSWINTQNQKIGPSPNIPFNPNNFPNKILNRTTTENKILILEDDQFQKTLFFHLENDENRYNNRNPSINYPNIKIQQNFISSDGINSNGLSNVIAISDGKGSDQIIPVIKHVVIEKHVPYLLLNNDNPSNNQGFDQNSHNFNQAQQYLTNPSSSGLGNNYVNNVEASVSGNENSVQSNQWALNSANQINGSPQTYENNLNNLNQQNQYIRNEDTFSNDQVYENFKSDSRNPENDNRVKFNQGTISYNSNNRQPFFDNSNVNINQNSGTSSQSVQSYNPVNPINQEFSNDAEIKEAFKVAGIYLQNQIETPPSRTETNASPHNRYEARTLNNAPHDIKTHQNTPVFANDIRPTTDQRYNALYHEKNNNLNIIRLRDQILQPHRSMDPVQHYNNELRKQNNFNNTNRIQENVRNSVGSTHKISNDLHRESPKQNGWQVHQNVRNIQSSVTYNNDESASSNHRPEMSHTNTQHSRDIKKTSFQIKDAIAHPQQRNFNNQNLNINKPYPEQYLYNNAPEQLNNPSVVDYTSKENKGVLVFTGYGKEDWKANAENNRNTNTAQSQQPVTFYQKNEYKEDSSKRMDQRPFVSGSGTSNNNRDHHDKTTKGWYKREVENIEKDSTKSDSGKIRNGNDYVINDADGADSNGFGGENFW